MTPSALPARAARPSLLRNIGGYGVFAVLLAFFLTATLLLGPRRILRPVKAILRLMFRIVGLRARVIGSEHLDPGRPYLYVSNHVTAIDHLIELAYLPGYIVGLEKIEMMRLPVYGWAARRWGQVHIDRTDSRSALESCRQIEKRLLAGTSIAVYPEGTRSRDGRLQPFKKGGFHIAVDTHATVVPIALKHLHRLMPPGRMLVAAGEFELHIGKPFTAPEPGPDAVGQLSQQVRFAMLAALDEELPVTSNTRNITS
jgi:1-acyl-sn-glycerol-3-phosphate acyltransferase